MTDTELMAELLRPDITEREIYELISRQAVDLTIERMAAYLLEGEPQAQELKGVLS